MNYSAILYTYILTASSWPHMTHKPFPTYGSYPSNHTHARSLGIGSLGAGHSKPPVLRERCQWCRLLLGTWLISTRLSKSYDMCAHWWCHLVRRTHLWVCILVITRLPLRTALRLHRRRHRHRVHLELLPHLLPWIHGSCRLSL